jgi:hypothetical protein
LCIRVGGGYLILDNHDGRVYGNGTSYREPLCDQCYSDIYGQSRLNQSNRNGQNSRDGVSNGGKGNDLEDRDTVEDIGLGSGSDRRQMFGDGYDDRNGVGKNIGSRETTGREGIGENSGSDRGSLGMSANGLHGIDTRTSDGDCTDFGGNGRLGSNGTGEYAGDRHSFDGEEVQDGSAVDGYDRENVGEDYDSTDGQGRRGLKGLEGRDLRSRGKGRNEDNQDQEEPVSIHDLSSQVGSSHIGEYNDDFVLDGEIPPIDWEERRNRRKGRYRNITATEGAQEDDSSNGRGPRWRRGNLRKLKQERTDVSARKCTLKDLQHIDPLDYLAKYCIIK